MINWAAIFSNVRTTYFSEINDNPNKLANSLLASLSWNCDVNPNKFGNENDSLRNFSHDNLTRFSNMSPNWTTGMEMTKK